MHRGHFGTRGSTNPFDTDSDHDDSSDCFHDATDTLSLRSNSVDNHDGKTAVALSSPAVELESFRVCVCRTPKTSLNKCLYSYGCIEEEHREAEFLSPLEEALLQWNDVNPDKVMPLSPMASDLGTSFAADDSMEVPDWAAFEQQTHDGTSGQSVDAFVSERGSRRRSSSAHRRSKRSSNRKPAFSTPVLETIEVEDSEFDMDIQGGGNTPWTKLLLLEELGTASSWAVLVIPYVAFVLSIILDTDSSVFLENVGPLLAERQCSLKNTTSGGSEALWLPLAEETSCFYPFVMQQQPGMSNYQFQSNHYRKTMHEGWAFVSGLIHNVPPMSDRKSTRLNSSHVD